jgi:sulfite reductase (NADPH) hemoprotein beta-component
VLGRHEFFIETLRRVGQDPFKAAANAARHPAEETTA